MDSLKYLMHDEKYGDLLKCYLDFNKCFYFEVVLPKNSCVPVLQYRKLLGSPKDWIIKSVNPTLNKSNGGYLKKAILKNNFSFEAEDISSNSLLKYFQTHNELVIDDNKITYIDLSTNVISSVYSFTSEFARTLTDKEFVSMFLFDDKFKNIVVNCFDNPKDAISFESKMKQNIFDVDLGAKIDFLKLFILCAK